MNGKIPQRLFDKFVEEYQGIVSDFDYEHDIEITTKARVSLSVDDEEISIEEIEVHDDGADDVTIEDVSAKSAKAKKIIEDFNGRMLNFKNRLRETCQQHDADFEDKLEKIRNRAY